MGLLSTVILMAPVFSQSESSLNTLDTLDAHPHEFRVMGVFHFGSSGDNVYSGLYVVPISGGSEFAYTYRDDFMKHMAMLRGSYGKLFSPYEKINPGYDSLSEIFFQLLFKFSSSFSVWQGGGWNLRVGGGLHFYGDSWIHESAGEFPIVRHTWFFHLGVGPEISLDWNLRSHRVSFGVYTSLLGVGWRPYQSLVSFEQEDLWETGHIMATLFYYPKFLSLHNALYLDLRINYDYFFNDRWSLGLGIYEIIQTTSVPRERQDLHTLILAGVAYHWQ